MERQVTPCTGLVAFESWLASLNKTRITGWRWEKAGIVETVNIFGRKYIPREQIAEFERRALAGEFSREVKVPKRKAAK